ncbi:hypothetical protein ACG7TL_006152 [Trametes sanguinea]
MAKTMHAVHRNTTSTASETPSDGGSSDTGRSETSQLRAPHETFSDFRPEDLLSEYDPFAVDLNTILNPSATDPNHSLHLWEEQITDIPARPGLQFTRETWWDALLSFYASEGSADPVESLTLTAEQRSTVMRSIVTDVRALFRSSLYWVSFIHIPRFFNSILDPNLRSSLQPSLLLTALALGTLAQSSEAENGAAGRARALKLMDMADSALQASLASGWVDLGLVQASWLMLYFELQSHPSRCDTREQSAMLLLDSLMRLFSLTGLDADMKQHPHSYTSSMVSMFNGYMPVADSNPATFASAILEPPRAATPNTVLNAVLSAANMTYGPAPPSQNATLTEPYVPDNTTLGPSTSLCPGECNCVELTISRTWPSVHDIAPSFAGMPMWPTGLSEGEFRKEECRRLVWATVMMTASLNSFISLTGCFEHTKLSIQDPRNYAVMFPGESLAMAGFSVQPNNVWTLYLRAMLLLQCCVRVRGDKSLGDGDRAQYAMKAWLEMEAIEAALDRHTCGLERNLGFQAREMLFSARICVSHDFQRYIPQITTQGSRFFYRDKAEGWLKHRMAAAERVWGQLIDGEHVPAVDFRKPLLIYWFMSHVIKALVLWKADPTLTIALTASKVFVQRAEYIMMFWPTEGQRRDWQELRYRLVQACLEAGIPPPEPNLPAPFPRKTTV